LGEGAFNVAVWGVAEDAQSPLAGDGGCRQGGATGRPLYAGNGPEIAPPYYFMLFPLNVRLNLLAPCRVLIDMEAGIG
jgi:hypothetical protein